jgi:hypothetical protein
MSLEIYEDVNIGFLCQPSYFGEKRMSMKREVEQKKVEREFWTKNKVLSTCWIPNLTHVSSFTLKMLARSFNPNYLYRTSNHASVFVQVVLSQINDAHAIAICRSLKCDECICMLMRMQEKPHVWRCGWHICISAANYGDVITIANM